MIIIVPNEFASMNNIDTSMHTQKSAFTFHIKHYYLIFMSQSGKLYTNDLLKIRNICP